MRLIDADELKQKLFIEDDNWNPIVTEKEIDEAPTIEAIPVVRCKDCKHWHKDIGWCDKHSNFIDKKGGACHPWESDEWKMFLEDDFCSDGRRKKEVVDD